MHLDVPYDHQPWKYQSLPPQCPNGLKLSDNSLWVATYPHTLGKAVFPNYHHSQWWWQMASRQLAVVEKCPYMWSCWQSQNMYMCLCILFPPEGLFPGTKNFLRNSVHLLTFSPEEPWSKFSCGPLFYPPNRPCLEGGTFWRFRNYQGEACSAECCPFIMSHKALHTLGFLKNQLHERSCFVLLATVKK